MSRAGLRLRVIQEFSGHRNLDWYELQKYLKVSDEQVLGAAALSMLSPAVELVNWLLELQYLSLDSSENFTMLYSVFFK